MVKGSRHLELPSLAQHNWGQRLPQQQSNKKRGKDEYEGLFRDALKKLAVLLHLRRKVILLSELLLFIHHRSRSRIHLLRRLKHHYLYLHRHF